MSMLTTRPIGQVKGEIESRRYHLNWRRIIEAEPTLPRRCGLEAARCA